MVKTKQTPRGASSSHQPTGMAAATFTGTGRGRGRGEPKEQFRDAPGEDTKDSQDLPMVLEDAEQPPKGEPSTSKSEGKTGKPAVQATEGTQAPPEEIPPGPNPTDPIQLKQRNPLSTSRSSHRRPHPSPRRGRPHPGPR